MNAEKNSETRKTISIIQDAFAKRKPLKKEEGESVSLSFEIILDRLVQHFEMQKEYFVDCILFPTAWDGGRWQALCVVSIFARKWI